MPSKPCQFTSKLVVKAFAVAGSADQANLLKNVDHEGGVVSDVVLELCHTIDLATRPASSAALLLSRVKEKERSFRLDAPNSPSVEMVVYGEYCCLRPTSSSGVSLIS